MRVPELYPGPEKMIFQSFTMKDIMNQLAKCN